MGRRALSIVWLFVRVLRVIPHAHIKNRRIYKKKEQGHARLFAFNPFSTIENCGDENSLNNGCSGDIR